MGLSGWAKTCHIYANMNLIACANPDHHSRVTVTQAHIDQGVCVPGARLKDKRPVRKGTAEIIGLMQPFKRAACECERSACKEAWTWNRPGTFQSEYVQAPNLFKGVGSCKLEDTPRRVMPISFRLTAGELKVLHARFPNWHFVIEGTSGHDHPISHATTQVVAWELMHSLRPGKSYLDLHGNPTANERLAPEGVTVDTYVSLASAKDYLRMKTKWGPEMKGNRRRYTKGGIISNRWHNTPDSAIAENRDGFLSIHTGYYYKPEEVLSVLKKSPDATFTMIMHKFDGKDGSFNEGELVWSKETKGNDDTAVVTQVNARTGETYRHPDNAFWFKNTSWTNVTPSDAHLPGPAKEEMRALSWTLGQCCEGVYKVTVVAMPAYAAYLDEAKDSWRPDEGVLAKWGGVDLDVGQERVFMPLPTKAEALFDELRKKMNHQQRTQKKFAAHVQTCNQKAQLYEQTNGLKLNSKELSAIQVASFWVDFAHDLRTDGKLVVDGEWAVQSYGALLTGQSLRLHSNKVDAALTVVHALVSSNDRKAAAVRFLDFLRTARSQL